MTQPDTLHARLRAEINRRLDNAQATHDDGGWESLARWLPSLAEYLNLNGPADAIRRYEGELEVLERHEPVYKIPKTEGGQRWVCRSRCKPEICVELTSLAHRLGVSVDG